MENLTGHHFVAIIGGAVSGSEAAHQLAKRGFRVVVFDQNLLPYGKIEDGLPKWHVKLRDKEERAIDSKLSQEHIRYVPGVKLGRDIFFDDLVNNWGFSAILLATGAWKDRPLPVPGIDQYVNKGLVYQNPFIYWFNHFHEPDYQGPYYPIRDNAIVIGGGLASLDVVKVLMIETVHQALEDRGIQTDMFTLEKSIKKVLDDHHLTLKDLGLTGCTLYYRRRAIDMPLSPIAKDTPEAEAKAQKVAQKIMENFQNKYLFHFEPCAMPVDKLVEQEQLKGMVFQKTEIQDGKVVAVPGSEFTARSPLVISSIGSIPEKIEGIPFDGPLFRFTDPKSCQVEGYEHVFALGNAVTGRGNIKESLEHGKEVSLEVMDHFFDWQENDYEKWLRTTESTIEKKISSIAEQIQQKKFMPDEVIQSILDRTEALQRKVGYDGEYDDWIDKLLPDRLENI
ncbi:FAD-dependent oxidoreductase [Rapidithrix thailandica]|uniref:FAD-dependent oxidoreductase n=1 Tax=Rapidithrix thailandica TaxID=413964 RepID=A0AAW9RYJ8_9BACT